MLIYGLHIGEWRSETWHSEGLLVVFSFTSYRKGNTKLYGMWMSMHLEILVNCNIKKNAEEGFVFCLYFIF